MQENYVSVYPIRFGNFLMARFQFYFQTFVFHHQTVHYGQHFLIFSGTKKKKN